MCNERRSGVYFFSPIFSSTSVLQEEAKGLWVSSKASPCEPG